MTEFDEIVAFLEQECVDFCDIDYVRRYTLESRVGLTKDFYVNFDAKKCNTWDSDIPLTVAIVKGLAYMGFDFKTHVQIQQELDRII